MNLVVDGQYCALRNIPVIDQVYVSGSIGLPGYRT
jgi:hypothetical protein